MNIGDKIKEERLKKEWTQEQLAKLLNVSRSTVSSWEVGRNYPDLETIIAISDLFRISLDHLLREDKQMAKETTKKIKRGKIYKIALIMVGVFLLLYFGYNAKLRLDERAYRANLEENGWVRLANSPEGNADSNNYELTEDGIVYWTQISPSGIASFPLPGCNISIITRQDNFMIEVSYEDDVAVKLSPENDPEINKAFFVKINGHGGLAETKDSWSEDELRKIRNYLEKYQDVHEALIEKTREKKQEIIGN